MSDPEVTLAPSSVAESSIEPPHNNQNHQSTTTTFTIWPLSQRTRDAVINRLIETLSTPSILSKRYGTLSSEESSTVAVQIEDEAFAAASAASEEDGIEILQLYSNVISKRMLETVKARSTTPFAAVDNDISASDDTHSSSEESVTIAPESGA
ncbi:hypothetical protein TanjilG_30616 [Lupinus angustifolius]|uniref:WPP domain-containing protein n=1 Tax=Lupinus angustifolius TaxID=3871 RepID=A0A4P1RNH9_LUPAN|nr:PREDICTED: MFP1 attachment factor 1-like [Lupinus angustifolius]OIW14897.1 hypothetical protein TanjilG_30616 [Lupinus angustifolius]